MKRIFFLFISIILQPNIFGMDASSFHDGEISDPSYSYSNHKDDTRLSTLDSNYENSTGRISDGSDGLTDLKTDEKESGSLKTNSIDTSRISTPPKEIIYNSFDGDGPETTFGGPQNNGETTNTSDSQPERTITLEQNSNIQKTTTDGTPDKKDQTQKSDPQQEQTDGLGKKQSEPTSNGDTQKTTDGTSDGNDQTQKSDPKQEQTGGLGKKQSEQAPESKESKSITNIDTMRAKLQQKGVLPDADALNELLANLPEKMSDPLKAKLKLLTEELIEACNRDLSELGTKKINKQKLELLRTIHEKYSALYEKLNAISEKGNFLLVKNTETDIADKLTNMKTRLDTIKEVIDGEKKISSLKKEKQTDSKIIIANAEKGIKAIEKRGESTIQERKKITEELQRLRSRERLDILKDSQKAKLDSLDKRMQKIKEPHMQTQSSSQSIGEIQTETPQERKQAVENIGETVKGLLKSFDEAGDKNTQNSIVGQINPIFGPIERAHGDTFNDPATLDPDTFTSIQKTIRSDFLKIIGEYLERIEERDQELSQSDQELSNEQLEKEKKQLVEKRQFALFLLDKMSDIQKNIKKSLENKANLDPTNEKFQQMKDELSKTQDQISDLIVKYDPRYRPLETTL